MAEISMRQLATEMEHLRMRVTALKQALDDAGIPIPLTPVERQQEAKALERQWSEAAARGE